MEIKDFIENFIEALEIESTDTLTPDTDYRELDEWDSLGALTAISMIDDVYSVTVTNKELRALSTIQELFDLVLSKK